MFYLESSNVKNVKMPKTALSGTLQKATLKLITVRPKDLAHLDRPGLPQKSSKTQIQDFIWNTQVQKYKIYTIA